MYAKPEFKQVLDMLGVNSFDVGILLDVAAGRTKEVVICADFVDAVMAFSHWDAKTMGLQIKRDLCSVQQRLDKLLERPGSTNVAPSRLENEMSATASLFLVASDSLDSGMRETESATSLYFHTSSSEPRVIGKESSEPSLPIASSTSVTSASRSGAAFSSASASSGESPRRSRPFRARAMWKHAGAMWKHADTDRAVAVPMTEANGGEGRVSSVSMANVMSDGRPHERIKSEKWSWADAAIATEACIASSGITGTHQLDLHAAFATSAAIAHT